MVYVRKGHLKFTDENGKVNDVYVPRREARFFPPFHPRRAFWGDKALETIHIGHSGKDMSPRTRHRVSIRPPR